jgi:hypothetical protein
MDTPRDFSSPPSAFPPHVVWRLRSDGAKSRLKNDNDKLKADNVALREDLDALRTEIRSGHVSLTPSFGWGAGMGLFGIVLASGSLFRGFRRREERKS